MKYNTLTLTPVLGRIFHGSGFFQIGSRFLADPHPDSEKKADPDPGKKPGSETLYKNNNNNFQKITFKLRKILTTFVFF